MFLLATEYGFNWWVKNQSSWFITSRTALCPFRTVRPFKVCRQQARGEAAGKALMQTCRCQAFWGAVILLCTVVYCFGSLHVYLLLQMMNYPPKPSVSDSACSSVTRSQLVSVCLKGVTAQDTSGQRNCIFCWFNSNLEQLQTSVLFSTWSSATFWKPDTPSQDVLLHSSRARLEKVGDLGQVHMQAFVNEECL